MKLVVKIGGSLVIEGAPDLVLNDIAARAKSDSVILVHGGGDLVTEYAEKMGKQQKFVVSPDGMRSRYTDREMAELYTMVMSGLVAKRLVLSLTQRGLKVVSLTGLDGSLLRANRKKKLVIVDERGRRVAIEGGYTGRVESVNAGLIQELCRSGYIPLISPVAISEDGDPLNVDGDRAASSVASSVKADTLLFLTNVDGVMDGGTLLPKLSASEARARIPSIGFGMQKKVVAAVEAVEQGVGEAIICSGVRPSPITQGLAHYGCTMIS